MRSFQKNTRSRCNLKQFLRSAITPISLFGCMTIASGAHAHGLWFAPRVSQIAVVYGVGSQDLEIAKRQSDIKSIHGYNEAWQPVETKLLPAGPLLFVDMENQPTAITAVLDNGYYVKLSEDGDWLKKGRDEAPEAVMAEKAMKYAVYVTKPLRSPIPPLPTQILQIIPVDDRWPTMQGDQLKVKVIMDGKPAVGAKVKADYVTDVDAEPKITGDDGTVTITVRNQGLNVVSASHYGPTDNAVKADRIEHTATLTFVLPQKSN